MYARVGREEERPCWRWRPRDIIDSPSRQGGVSLSLERTLRVAAVAYISNMSKRLCGDGVSRVPMTTACVLFHRFYMRQSMTAHDRHIIAAACLFLATKVEEVHKKVKHFISVAYCCQHELDTLPFDVGSPPYLAYRDQLLDAERRLLYTLEMDVAVEQPFALATHQIKKWRDSGRFGTHTDKPMELAMLDKAASNVAFDCMTSELCLLFTAKEIAVGSLWIAWHSITLADRFSLEDKDFGALVDLRLLGAVVHHYVDMSNWNLGLEAKLQAAFSDASVSPAAGAGTLFSRSSSDLSTLSFAALGPGIALLPFSEASPVVTGASAHEAAK